MKNTVQEMTCIVCPNGCRLQVMEKDGNQPIRLYHA